MAANEYRDYRDRYIESMGKVVIEALQPAFNDLLYWALSVSDFDSLLTQTDAAKMKGCSRQAIQRAIKQGRLATYTRYNMVLWQDVMKLQIKGLP